MANPAEQLAALAKANFGLCARLGQIAAEEGQEYLRVGNKAMSAIADQSRTAAMRVLPTNQAGTNTVPADDAFNILAEVQKGQERIGSDLKTAVEEWQRAWMGAVIPVSDTKTSTDFFGLFFKPWAGRSITPEEAKPATRKSAGSSA
ncbi:hypothetical protein [Sphingomonas oryzagri]